MSLYKISAKKKYRGVVSHKTLKSDAKFEEKLICCFKNDNVFTEKSTEELSFMTLKSDPKIEEKLFCGFENDLRNFANFHQTT